MAFSFQKIVLTIAIIIFIFLMIFIASVLHNNTGEFPPTLADCPDYWLDKQKTINSSGEFGEGDKDSKTKQTCYNVQNLGKTSCSKTMDFTGDFWQGSTGLCNKYKWAKSCDLTWDGITSDTTLCD